MIQKELLPLAARSWARPAGHWLLTRLGKRALWPAGLELTTSLLAAAGIGGSDLVELVPALGRTAKDIGALRPASYIGVDGNCEASALVQQVIDANGGSVVVADAASTGLEPDSVDVVVDEAMLTMQSDRGRRPSSTKPSGCSVPAVATRSTTRPQADTIAQETKYEIRRAWTAPSRSTPTR